MRLDDLQVERYSRQIVLPEIGPAGQARLLASRVAIVGAGSAAELVLGYLAAAGVGMIAASDALRFMADPGQTDVRVETLAAGTGHAFDAAVISGTHGGDPPPARRSFWIYDGRAGEIPPCPACAAAGLPLVAPVATELRSLRDALLGTVVATEVVKALLGLAVSLRGQVIAYEPETASVAVAAVPPRSGCRGCKCESRLED